MDTRRVKGLQVITHEGSRVGTVEQVFFDPATQRVAAFALEADPERADAAASVVDAAAVHALGADALTLAADPGPGGASPGIDLNALVSMDELAKRQVMTESGVRLGQIAGIEVDPQTLRLERIEVSAGFFKGNKAIEAEQVTSLGSSAIMVADALADALAAPDADPT
jgi:sporulation protein YlmC with PRC-barrel domain